MSLNALFLLPMLAASPYAQIETKYTDRTDTNNFQVLVLAVDGSAYLSGRDEMKLEPGFHFIEMTAERSGTRALRKNHVKSLYIVAKPCFRYYVTGQRSNELDFDWKVRVGEEERIKACKTKEDIEQAKIEKKKKREEKVLNEKVNQSVTPLPTEGNNN